MRNSQPVLRAFCVRASQHPAPSARNQVHCFFHASRDVTRSVGFAPSRRACVHVTVVADARARVHAWAEGEGREGGREGCTCGNRVPKRNGSA
ncbi:hypothetical protein BCR44DRAFT_1439483 [Catenaria anguillulae PL171]|uniref:Uncharacterized protein n=1 Tax=Catenaria anguillulae PL171 TaxID=765915 RepID=A0A1Y2HEA1_9FUNG|nr:hypothetical protein BCR44DRAFT_1439483 [Catenaria anguillulae PL171]